MRGRISRHLDCNETGGLRPDFCFRPVEPAFKTDFRQEGRPEQARRNALPNGRVAGIEITDAVLPITFCLSPDQLNPAGGFAPLPIRDRRFRNRRERGCNTLPADWAVLAPLLCKRLSLPQNVPRSNTHRRACCKPQPNSVEVAAPVCRPG